ncbi:MAG TPA: nitrous oxide reductase family maturation protein NosD, partial [Bacteroidia bacterium]|nr:nitrous oxide reductase family maturation protein NosD [Bacteroidia bacterium]
MILKKILPILILTLLGTQTNGATFYVGTTFRFNKIQDAINMSTNGDTVIVKYGLYKEGNIIINKQITLLGENFPVLDGQKKFEVVSVKSSHVTIDGFKIQHSGYA